MHNRHKIKTKIRLFSYHPGLFFNGLFTFNLSLRPFPDESVLQSQLLEASRPFNVTGKSGTNIARQTKKVVGVDDFLHSLVKIRFCVNINDPHPSNLYILDI